LVKGGGEGQVLGVALFFDALFFGSSPCGFPPMLIYLLFLLVNVHVILFSWLTWMDFSFWLTSMPRNFHAI
jgi:hypothetical protein